MKKTYEFENLGCAHCAGKMEEKISNLPEVESVNLSFPMKKMYVETSSEDLLPVIQKICTDIEPDVIVKEVLKKSSSRKHHEEHEHAVHFGQFVNCPYLRFAGAIHELPTVIFRVCAAAFAAAHTDRFTSSILVTTGYGLHLMNRQRL